jgi:hypothetical protein
MGWHIGTDRAPDHFKNVDGSTSHKAVQNNVRSGSKGDLTVPKLDFRFTPRSGLRAGVAPERNDGRRKTPVATAYIPTLNSQRPGSTVAVCRACRAR